MNSSSAPPPTSGVKYIGSKAALIHEILSFVSEHCPSSAPKTIIDVFTGTTRVAQAFRAKGWTVTSSDLSWASEAYAHAFLLRTPDSSARIPALITELKHIMDTDIPGQEPGWIETSYCDVTTPEGGIVRMWKPVNGRKADRVRESIASWLSSGKITEHESMILVAILIFALDKVDSSVGVQQAYLKTWAARASNPIQLEDLPYPDGPTAANHIVGNALEIEYPAASVAYIDPPYSPHSYATYYHIWDSITRWDKPAVGLKTNRRLDRVSGSDSFDTTMASAWNSKKEALHAFLQLVKRLPVQYIVISYNDESIVPLEKLEVALKELDCVKEMSIKYIPYKRNIMCQIGNAAEKGEDAKKENKEVLIWLEKKVC
jgi:adenine-specific DNA-methyltransferase